MTKPGANVSLVTHLLLDANEVLALDATKLKGTPTFWVPLGSTTKPGALDALCLFANSTAPRLIANKKVDAFSLLTLP